MEQYIKKSALMAEIRKRLLPVIRDKHYDEWEEGQDSERITILGILDTIEVREVEEEDVNNDLEDYAKKESESFAEREYEIDYIDRNALAKGYYWGVKAGAQWQKQKNTIEVKEIDLEKEMENWIENNQDTAGFYNNVEFAKHFFELGLNTKYNNTQVKEEDLDKLSDDITNKVVGNYNEGDHTDHSGHNAYWCAFREGVLKGLKYMKGE